VTLQLWQRRKPLLDTTFALLRPPPQDVIGARLSDGGRASGRHGGVGAAFRARRMAVIWKPHPAGTQTNSY